MIFEKSLDRSLGKFKFGKFSNKIHLGSQRLQIPCMELRTPHAIRLYKSSVFRKRRERAREQDDLWSPIIYKPIASVNWQAQAFFQLLFLFFLREALCNFCPLINLLKLFFFFFLTSLRVISLVWSAVYLLKPSWNCKRHVAILLSRLPFLFSFVYVTCCGL